MFEELGGDGLLCNNGSLVEIVPRKPGTAVMEFLCSILRLIYTVLVELRVTTRSPMQPLTQCKNRDDSNFLHYANSTLVYRHFRS